VLSVRPSSELEIAEPDFECAPPDVGGSGEKSSPMEQGGNKYTKVRFLILMIYSFDF